MIIKKKDIAILLLGFHFVAFSQNIVPDSNTYLSLENAIYAGAKEFIDSVKKELPNDKGVFVIN